MAVAGEWTGTDPFQRFVGAAIRGVAAVVLWAVLIELALRTLPIEVFTWLGLVYPLQWTLGWVWPAG